jgi:hypothetical protein
VEAIDFLVCGRPAIPGPVIETGYTKRMKIETYPLKVKVVHNANIGKSTSWQCSRAMMMKEFKEKVCAKLQIDPAKVRIWKLKAWNLKTVVKLWEMNESQSLMFQDSFRRRGHRNSTSNQIISR